MSTYRNDSGYSGHSSKQSTSSQTDIRDESNTSNTNIGDSNIAKDSLEQDCEELKIFLRKKLKENCWHEAPQFVDRPVRYVPLELTRIINKDDDTLKEEVQQMRYKQPSGDLKLENLFVESRKSAEKSAKFNPPANTPKDTKDGRLDFLSNVVAIIAPAGYGKSFLCKKMLQLIDNETIKAEFVFYLKFRDIDYKRRTNLLTFLTGKAEYEEYGKEKIKKLVNCISKSQDVYLICDGLDESSLPKSGTNSTDDIHGSRAENFIFGLLCGEILPKSKKLITSRPRTLWELPKKYQPHFIAQILGISKDSQKQLCDDVCGKVASESIFDHVQHCKKLLFYCHIPLFLTLIFHILSCNHDKSNMPTSITQVFVALIILYTDGKSESRGEVPLEKLCSLALHGILNRKIFFEHDDMKAFGLEKSDQNDFTVTIQCQDTKKRVSLLKKATVEYTYFGHLEIQEFFAALQLVLFENVEKCEELLFATDRKIDLLDTDYDVFALCMFGLFNEVTYCEYLRNLSVKFNHESYKQKVLLFKRFIENIELRYDNACLTKFSHKIVEFIYEFGDDAMTRQFANNLKNYIRINVGSAYNVVQSLLPNQVLPLNYLLRQRSKEIELHVECWPDEGIRFLTELGVTLEENPIVKLMILSLFMQITDKVLEASKKSLKKVVEGIWVGDSDSDCFVGLDFGFISNDVALKFATCIMERETKLMWLDCFVSRDHDRIEQALRRCQENVQYKIMIRRNYESEEESEEDSSLSEIKLVILLRIV